MVVHTFNPSTKEAEAGSLQAQDQPELQSEFKSNRNYSETLYQKKQAHEHF